MFIIQRVPFAAPRGGLTVVAFYNLQPPPTSKVWTCWAPLEYRPKSSASLGWQEEDVQRQRTCRLLWRTFGDVPWAPSPCGVDAEPTSAGWVGLR